MKKLFTILLTLLMMFTLAGCNFSKEEKEIIEEPVEQVQEVIQEQEITVGGFIDVNDGTITVELKEMFDKALEGLLGAEYEAIELVATQVVAGTNYKFLAKGTKTTNPITTGTYYVTIYKDLEDNVSLLDIQTIEEKQEETKAEETQDITSMKFWVVFYDENDNELQREALLYGTVPQYTKQYPNGFVKWTNKKTGNDVNELTAIKGNTYYKAVCNHTNEGNETKKSYSPFMPIPRPIPKKRCDYDIENEDTSLIYIRGYIRNDEYIFDKDTPSSLQDDDLYIVEEFKYNKVNKEFVFDNADKKQASLYGAGKVGKYYHLNKLTEELVECENINSHKLNKEPKSIFISQDSLIKPDDTIYVLIMPHNATNNSFEVTVDDPDVSFVINKEKVTFSSDDTTVTTATITIKDTTITKEVSLDFVGCLSEGTLITMADGSKTLVESLKTGDEVLVLDHATGLKSTSKIIDLYQYEKPAKGAFTLHFTNNIDITVVSGHCFYEKDEHKYVKLNKDTVDKYIGHSFYNLDQERWETLLGVDYIKESKKTFIVVTANTLNCSANGMLNIDDGIYYVLGNIFEYDNNLRIDAEKKEKDLKNWGIWEFENAKYINKDAYDGLNLQYLNVAIGKGLISEELLEKVGAYTATFDSDFVR